MVRRLPLARIRHQNVHVRVHADQATGVLLSPFDAHEDVFAHEALEHGTRVERGEGLCGGGGLGQFHGLRGVGGGGGGGGDDGDGFQWDTGIRGGDTYAHIVVLFFCVCSRFGSF